MPEFLGYDLIFWGIVLGIALFPQIYFRLQMAEEEAREVSKEEESAAEASRG